MKTEILSSIDDAQGRLSARFFRSDMLLRVTQLSRRSKQAALITFDLFALTSCLWLGFYLRLDTFLVPQSLTEAALLLAGPVSLVAVFVFTGVYRYVTRYFGPDAITRAAITAVIGTGIWQLVVAMIDPAYVVPRSVIAFYAITATLTVWGSRHIIGWVLRNADVAQREAQIGSHAMASLDDVLHLEPALIYGANERGRQLGQALVAAGAHNHLVFVDEDETLWGRRIGGHKVFGPTNLEDLIARKGVRRVYLALPDGPVSQRKAIVQTLERQNVQVKTLPSFKDITSGRVAIQDLQPVDINDLLGRDRVPADPDLLHRSIVGKVVMVSGAGGSIGSEIARQVAEHQPAHLVLFDVSEVALYQVDADLSRRFGAGVRITAVLGSVLDDDTVRRTIAAHGVQTIYHAAAYKHVPIVELNPRAGLLNNTFGTRAIALAARDLGVERFVLISTDKAVRPTNIMGASKRLAEQVLQGLAAEQAGVGHGTIFTMVRFGNVLASSGSVLHTFRAQIERGGPLTVTHPDIRRYFMSIQEAAELVIQAGSMAEGGEVFVLDMGEPVRIDDLARQLIRLMGLTVRDAANPDGDIAIDYIGLRYGEKLYEELLVDDTSVPTSHPRILRNREPFPAGDAMEGHLTDLRSAIEAGDIARVHKVLGASVEGYVPEKRHLTPATTTQALPGTLAKPSTAAKTAQREAMPGALPSLPAQVEAVAEPER